MYVGRIVAVARNKDGRLAVLYRVSSRSFPNREAQVRDMSVAIVPKKGSEGDVYKNPYIAYNCLRIVGKTAVATNGSQTDPMAEKIASGMSIRDAMAESLLVLDYEKDDFCTPRIAVAVARGAEEGWCGVVRKDALIVRSFPLEAGKAFYFATYEQNEPRPEFVSEFRAATAAEAARWVVDGGRFADLEKPVCAAAALATASGFELAGYTVAG